MAFNNDISSAVAQYVYTQSNGNVVEPVNGSYLQAYCQYLGITESVNDSWLIALCNYFGITAPLNGSWTIALANYYGITYPTGGTWWMALAFAAIPGPTPTPVPSPTPVPPTPTPIPPTPTPSPTPVPVPSGFTINTFYNTYATGGIAVNTTDGLTFSFETANTNINYIRI